MTRYAMAVDLRRCVGCQTCTAACKEANATPPGVQWRRVLDLESGQFPDVRRDFLPVGCMHCANPPCEAVCPTTATRKRADGLVTIDYDLCIGCANCIMACPYDARSIVHEAKFAYGDAPMANERLGADPARLGVATKCTFCKDRLDQAARSGQVPGRDPEVTPACVNSCIAGALVFGDRDDAQSTLSRLLAEAKHFRMHEGLGTDPGVYYLHEHADAPARPTGAPVRAAAVRQRYWDARAAGNFIGGGSGGALIAFAALAFLFGADVRVMMAAGAALIAAGLGCVWFEIGRPWRSLNVFRHPGSSWMSREALVAPFLLGSGLLGAFTGASAFIIAAGVLGAVYLYCQGRMLTANIGISAWRGSNVLPLMLTTGLAEGAGLLALASPWLPAMVLAGTAAALIVLLSLRSLLWKRYVAALEAGGAPEASRDARAAIGPKLLILGHALPALVAAAALLGAPGAAGLVMASGALCAGAGWWMKYAMVVRAAFIEPLALERPPVRGGAASVPSVKPASDERPVRRAEEALA